MKRRPLLGSAVIVLLVALVGTGMWLLPAWSASIHETLPDERDLDDPATREDRPRPSRTGPPFDDTGRQEEPTLEYI